MADWKAGHKNVCGKADNVWSDCVSVGTGIVKGEQLPELGVDLFFERDIEVKNGETNGSKDKYTNVKVDEKGWSCWWFEVCAHGFGNS